MAKKLVTTRPLPAGHVISHEDLCTKSPGDGLPPYEIDRIVGRALRQPVDAETALTFEMIEAVDMPEAAYGAVDAV
jgi:sialic acid synthase